MRSICCRRLSSSSVWLLLRSLVKRIHLVLYRLHVSFFWRSVIRVCSNLSFDFVFLRLIRVISILHVTHWIRRAIFHLFNRQLQYTLRDIHVSFNSRFLPFDLSGKTNQTLHSPPAFNVSYASFSGAQKRPCAVIWGAHKAFPAAAPSPTHAKVS